jgi:L-2-hydroxyglutarate oxidase
VTERAELCLRIVINKTEKMNHSYDIAIVGGGIIGCSLARELGKRFKKVLLLEKENAVGSHTSGRNSGVLHSGFNQKPGTLKSKLCVEGNRLARNFCRDKGIPCREVGTYVVATDESQLPRLKDLKRRAEANGVPNVEILDQDELRRREPHVRGVSAFFSPTGAVVESVRLTQSIAEEARRSGADIILSGELMHVEEKKEGIYLKTRDHSYVAELMINCAGLHADRIAHQMGVGKAFNITPFRGEYFETNSNAVQRVRGMIYAIPHPDFPFLGVHVTPTVHNTLILGPNAVLALGREAYGKGSFNLKDVISMFSHGGLIKALLKNAPLRRAAWHELKNSCSKEHFLKEASMLVEGLKPEDFKLSKRIGIRAQLMRKNGDFVDDLVIERTERSVHLLNVVSPGMTSALPFAKWLSEKIQDDFSWKEDKNSVKETQIRDLAYAN